MSEAESFSFIQSKAMSERKKMGEIADQIISGTLHP
ncbi:MAG: ANTAR domain-containing protein, partial [Actinobacteria bacterium]|nr:ANTAR domain-containing protein [Actinomycetota bacterium]